MSNKEIIKYYTEELNTLLRFYSTNDVYEIKNIRDRTLAIAYKEFLNKLNKPNLNTGDVSKILIEFFKGQEGKQLITDTILEIETFAKEYNSNL